MAGTEHERIEANTENANADVSAAALMDLIAGLAAQNLGNVYAYLIALVPSLALTLMIWRFIPHGMDTNEPSAPCGKARDVLGRVFTFLCQPSMAALLFFALITLGLPGCYRCYLFPIFASYGPFAK